MSSSQCLGFPLEGHIIFLNLLAMLFLMKPRRLLTCFAENACCWFIITLLSTRTPRFSAELLSSQLDPKAYGCVLHSTSAELCNSIPWNPCEPFWPISLCCEASSGYYHNHLVCHPLLPALHLPRVQSSLVSRSSMKMSNSIGPRINHQDTTNSQTSWHLSQPCEPCSSANLQSTYLIWTPSTCLWEYYRHGKLHWLKGTADFPVFHPINNIPDGHPS